MRARRFKYGAPAAVASCLNRLLLVASHPSAVQGLLPTWPSPFCLRFCLPACRKLNRMLNSAQARLIISSLHK